ncbi:hypothetical protein [Amycolatopsis plumensis]
MAANYASLQVVRRPEKAGHHTPEDQPQALADTLTTWLPTLAKPTTLPT